MSYDDDIISTIRLRAADETADVMRGMSERIKSATEGFKKMAEVLGGAEVARRSFEGYAELTRTLERLQFATKATDEQMADLGETFDDVSKRTGRSTDDIVKSFQGFYQMAGQEFGPGLQKIFKTIGESAEITGASIEDISRVAAAAVNNMKVPQKEMENLIQKWTVELPGQLGEFAKMAPRVMESMNAIGLTGAKNAEEIAVMFASLTNAFGNTRVAATEMNGLIEKLTDGSTMFGKMMTPTLMDIQQHGGSVVEVFDKMYKKLDDMHLFDKSTPPYMRKVLGIDLNDLKALQAAHDSMDKINRLIKEGIDPAKAFHDVLANMNKDPLAAMNELAAGFENVKNSFGEFLVEVGASSALKGLADTFSNISNSIRYLEGHEKLKESSNEDAWAGAGAGAGAAIGGVGGFAFGGGLGAVPGGLAGAGAGNAAARWLYRKTHGTEGGSKAFNEPTYDWHPPKMARGGIVSKPTIVEVGEAGKEAIVPLDQAGGGLHGLDTQNNTDATKDNTGAINRLSQLMSPTGPSGIGAAFNRGGGGGSGGGGGGNPALQGQVPKSLGGGLPSDSELDAKDKAWKSGGGHRGRGGGDGGPGSDGDTTPPNGNLAAQRAGFMKELDADPKLKAFAVDAMQHEGGIQSNLEQLFNYAAMRKMSIRQALHSGQYGPVNRGMISGNRGVSGKQQAALSRVGAGSNITDYATDQGMAGDPNFAKYMANREHYGMHKVEGAWFSAHGEQGVKWAQRQRAIDSATAANGGSSAPNTESVMKVNGHDLVYNKSSSGDQGGSVFDKGTSPLSHIHEQHQSMREDMERPIRMSVEAPTPPPIYSYRQRMARQQSRYQTDDHLQAPRYASQMDIGFA